MNMSNTTVLQIGMSLRELENLEILAGELCVPVAPTGPKTGRRKTMALIRLIARGEITCEWAIRESPQEIPDLADEVP
jgi:hypothetical protein